MNEYLIAACILTVLIGLIHSFLGEKLIFSKLRSGKLVPDKVTPPLQERHIRILWATWHMVSFFGFGFAVMLYCLAQPSSNLEIFFIYKFAIALSIFISAVLTLIATKGRHPGWIGLSLVSLLIYFS